MQDACMVVLSGRAVNRATLARQVLLERESVPAVDVVGRLVGMQGQEPKHPYVGLWSRIEGFGEAELDQAVADRDVVRATMFRGTLHLLTSADYLRFRTTVSPVLEAGLFEPGPWKAPAWVVVPQVRPAD